MRSPVPIITVLLFAVNCALVEGSRDAWASVMDIPQGQRVKVVDMKLKAWTGEFVGATEDAVTLRTGKGEVTIERSNVFRVTDLGWSKRGRNALIGFAIGTLVGTAIVANEDDLVPWGKIVIATGMFGGPGAAAGALVPSHPTIYRAKLPPGETQQKPTTQP